MDNVNWKSYRNLPRWPGIGHLAEVEQEKNDEDKLIFFFPRKVQWKHTETRVLHGRGKEDKSPARGRKPLADLLPAVEVHRKEDKSPARGRKHFQCSTGHLILRVRKISPLQGDGNQFQDSLMLHLQSCKEDKSPARGRKLF